MRTLKEQNSYCSICLLVILLAWFTPLGHSVVSAENNQTEQITIRSIGDILIHDYVYNAAATEDGYQFDSMLDPIKKYLENADITTANLEVLAGGDDLPLSTYPRFNAPSQIIDALKDAGVDIVNNATNHTLDLGSEGVHASIQALKNRQMMYVGSYESWDDYNSLRIIEAKGIKVGFLSYAHDANGNILPANEEYLLSLIDPELYPLEIERLNKEADLSVVMFHMGEEYEYLPTDDQLKTFRLARDAGANFVLGGHPHVLQPFIYYNETQAGIFSHGNFLSGQVDTENKIGGIIEYSFTVNKENKQVKLDKLRLMPTYNLGEDGGFQVVPLAQADEYGLTNNQELFDDLAYRSATFTNKVEVVEYLD